LLGKFGEILLSTKTMFFKESEINLRQNIETISTNTFKSGNLALEQRKFEN